MWPYSQSHGRNKGEHGTVSLSKERDVVNCSMLSFSM